jgi:GNAT superfamily N-acetyltransferase
MSQEIKVEPVSEGDFEALLPLIAAYQRFYKVAEPDDDRNREFFRRFVAPNEEGEILVAREGEGAEPETSDKDDTARSGEILGYTCLYWHYSSLDAADTVLLNDLFVTEDTRGRGVGRSLIEAAAEVARRRGCHVLEWSTAPDNHTAQRLYDSLTSHKTTWLTYELDV